jgi:hypothetical protein
VKQAQKLGAAAWGLDGVAVWTRVAASVCVC